MVNRVILIGNLGKDPEVRTLESGAMVARLRVATSENYKDRSGEWQTSTEWHDVILWRALAERAQSQLRKGDLVYIDGKLTHRTWQDSEGRDRYTTEVVASYFRSIGNRRDDEGAPRSAGADMAATTDAEEATASTPSAANTGGDSGADDDLPF
jgi:single-strand DNA-binding protein